MNLAQTKDKGHNAPNCRGKVKLKTQQCSRSNFTQGCKPIVAGDGKRAEKSTWSSIQYQISKERHETSPRSFERFMDDQRLFQLEKGSSN